MKKLFFALCILSKGILYSQVLITLKGNDTIFMKTADPFRSPGATAFDSIDGDITTSIRYFTDIDTAVPGYYTEEFTVTNSRNQETTRIRPVIVYSNIPAPVMTLIGPDTLYMEASRNNAAYEDPGADVAGNPGGLFSNVVVTGTVNTKQPGIYKVKLSAQNAAGMYTILYRTVIITDSKAPEWLDTASLYVIRAHEPFYHRVKLTDQCDSAPSFSFTTPGTGPADVDKPGLYSYIYTGRDNSGNTTAARNVLYLVVEDTAGPEIQLKGHNPLYIQYDCNNPAYTDPGLTAMDALEGDLTHHIKITGSVDTRNPGKYTIEYAVEDSSGHTSKARRTVFVVDTLGPKLIPFLNPVRIKTDIPYSPRPPKAWDDGCESTTIQPVMLFTNFNTSIPGNYIEVWQATDQRGNISEPCTVKINVIQFVSITPLKKTGLTIYPCPAYNFVAIRPGIQQSQWSAVRLFSADGRLVKEDIFLITDEFVYDISDIASGMYILQIETCGKTLKGSVFKD